MDLIAVGTAGLDALLSLILAIPNFLLIFLDVLFVVIDWLIYFVLHFWLVFALAEIIILGMAISQKEFMEKINTVLRLHRVFYIDIVYTLILNIIKLIVNVLTAIGSYVPFFG